MLKKNKKIMFLFCFFEITSHPLGNYHQVLRYWEFYCYLTAADVQLILCHKRSGFKKFNFPDKYLIKFLSNEELDEVLSERKKLLLGGEIFFFILGLKWKIGR